MKRFTIKCLCFLKKRAFFLSFAQFFSARKQESSAAAGRPSIHMPARACIYKKHRCGANGSQCFLRSEGSLACALHNASGDCMHHSWEPVGQKSGRLMLLISATSGRQTQILTMNRNLKKKNTPSSPSIWIWPVCDLTLSCAHAVNFCSTNLFDFKLPLKKA